MNTANKVEKLADELAAHWTEAALEILKDAGIVPISVGMELETWRILKRVLHYEMRWQRAFELPTLVSLRTVMAQVVRKAALLVAEKFAPQLVSYAFQTHLHRSARGRRATAAERRLYAEIVGQPALRAAFRPPSRTDFTPRLRVSALGVNLHSVPAL